MPTEPNKVVRVVVPLLILAGGVALAWSVLHNTQAGVGQPASAPVAKAPVTGADAQPTSPPASASPAERATAGAAGVKPDAPAIPIVQPPPTAAGGGAGAEPGRYSARTFPFSGYAPIGSLTAAGAGGTYELELRFSPFGAGLERLALANHYKSIAKTEHEVIQAFEPLAGATDPRVGIAAFAMNKVVVGTAEVELGLTASPNETFWRQTAPGAFESIILDGAGREALRITRRFTLEPGRFEFSVKQTVENISDLKLLVLWNQFGPCDLPQGTVRYGGDVRRVRFGFTRPTTLDPDQIVLADDSAASLIPHATALDKPSGVFPASGLPRWDPKQLWPGPESTSKKLNLAWVALSSRYFTVAVFGPGGGGGASGSDPAKSPPGRGGDKLFALGQRVVIDRLAIPPGSPSAGASGAPSGEMVLRVNAGPFDLEPGQSADVSMGAYAGPMSVRSIETQPAASWHGLQRIVIYTFGGPCAFCTFQQVAGVLREFLGLLHDYVLRDWALAIMFLVVCVRSLLHPVTRWSQTNMMRFQKQLARLAPKQKAIQEKYKGDQVKLREETARLMREENVNYYAGALGCLPMFMQMPVWIALYAMLFFTFELRHEHAFFGVIQTVTGHAWGFLGDLAEPDNFVPFGRAFYIPLLSGLMGPIQALNVLPFVLGVVFFIQQKYLTPPSATPLTPEQEQQQKIMKVMTVVMFPLLMYNAPSGLALYFMTNSSLGILESKWIRAHAEKTVEAEMSRVGAGVGTAVWDRKEKVPEKKGFMQRLQEAALQRQAQIDKAKKAAAKRAKK